MISLKNRLFISASALFLVMGTVSHQANASHTSFTQDDAYKIYKGNPGASKNGKLSWPIDGVSSEGIQKIIGKIDGSLMTFRGMRSPVPDTIKGAQEFEPALKTVVQCFARKLVDALYETHEKGEADKRFSTLKKADFVVEADQITLLDPTKLNSIFFTHIYVDIDGDEYSAFNRATSTAIVKGLKEENQDNDLLAKAIQAYLQIAQTAFQDTLDTAQTLIIQTRLEKEEEKKQDLQRFKLKAEESVDELLDERERLLKTLEEQEYESRKQKASILELESMLEELNDEIVKTKKLGQSNLSNSLKMTIGLIEHCLKVDQLPLTLAGFLGQIKLKTAQRLEEIESKSAQSSQEIALWYNEESERIVAGLNDSLIIAKKTIRLKEQDIEDLAHRLHSTEQELAKVKRQNAERIHDLEEENKRIEQARLKLEGDLKLENEKLKETELKLSQTEQRLARKERLFEDATQEVVDLKEEVRKKTETHDIVREGLRQSEKTKQRLETEIHQLEQKIRLSGTSNDDLQEELRQTKDLLTRATDEALDGARKLLAQEDKLHKSEKKLDKSKRLAESLAEDKAELEDKARKQQELVEKHEETIAALEEDKKQMQLHIDRIVDKNRDLDRVNKQLVQENALLKSNTTPTLQAQQKIARVKVKRDQALLDKRQAEAGLLLEQQAFARLQHDKGQVDNDLLQEQGLHQALQVQHGQLQHDKGLVDQALLQEQGLHQALQVQHGQLQHDKGLVDQALLLEQGLHQALQVQHGQLQHDKGLVDQALLLEQQVNAQLRLQLQQLQAQIPVAPVFTLLELQENAKWQAIYDHLTVDTRTKMDDGSFVLKDKAGQVIRWASPSSTPKSFEGSFVSQQQKAPTIVYK